MTHFSVDSEQVLAANVNIQNTISRLSAEADSLLAQLQNLQGSWTGVASNSFQELVVGWRATAATVDSQLGELGAALGVAAAQYAEIEYANQRLFL
jgi:early secretory antigenic target protein ESAT-6